MPADRFKDHTVFENPLENPRLALTSHLQHCVRYFVGDLSFQPTTFALEYMLMLEKVIKIRDLKCLFRR